MKLTDLIHEPALEVRVEAALRGMDWNYDVDPFNEVRLDKGKKALTALEAMVGALHGQKPELAQSLWETHCPYAQPGSLPASVLRRP